MSYEQQDCPRVPAPRALTFPQVLGKVASQTCLLQLNLSPVSMSHGSPSSFGVMTAGSCWVCGKDSVPQGLPGFFRSGVPKIQCDIPSLVAKQNVPTASKATEQLLQLSKAGTVSWQWQGTLGPSHHHHWCLERPDLEHASEFQISALCILQVFATKMLPHHESFLVSFLFEKFWSIHFDLGILATGDSDSCSKFHSIDWDFYNALLPAFPSCL